MTIQERLMADLKTAMKAGEKERVEAIRSARAALQSAQLDAAKARYDAAAQAIRAQYPNDDAAREAAMAAITIDASEPLDPAAQEAVIAREIKRRREAAEMFQKGNRAELAAKEEAEIAVLTEYLPQMLSPDELRPAVAALIGELGLNGPGDMGKLMPVLMERFKGQAEGRVLSQLARELLAR